MESLPDWIYRPAWRPEDSSNFILHAWLLSPRKHKQRETEWERTRKREGGRDGVKYRKKLVGRSVVVEREERLYRGLEEERELQLAGR